MYNHLFKSLTIKYMRSLNLIFQSPWYRSWTSGTGTLTPCCSYQINNWSGMSLFLCWWRRQRWFWVRIDIYLSVFFFIKEIVVYCTSMKYRFTVHIQHIWGGHLKALMLFLSFLVFLTCLHLYIQLCVLISMISGIFN